MSQALRWKEEPCESCNQPGILRIRWCSEVCAALALAPRPCIVKACDKPPWGEGNWICQGHLVYPVVQCAVRVFLNHDTKEQAARFVEIDTRLSTVIFYLRSRAGENRTKQDRLIAWTFPLVNLRWATADAIRKKEDATGLLGEFDRAVKVVEAKYRASY